MSESFFIAIASLATAFVSGVVLTSCKHFYKIKCITCNICGIVLCERDIEQENIGYQIEVSNPTPSDRIPSPTIPIRRNSR